jgi:hypothetical protein
VTDEELSDETWKKCPSLPLRALRFGIVISVTDVLLSWTSFSLRAARVSRVLYFGLAISVTGKPIPQALFPSKAARTSESE